MKRFVRIEKKDVAKPRFTFRPSNGECLIKVPHDTSEEHLKQLLFLGYEIIRNIPEDVVLTLRGAARLSDADKFDIRLQDNERKVFNFRFSIEDEIV